MTTTYPQPTLASRHAAPRPEAVGLSGISKSYTDTKGERVQAVKSLDLSIRQGEVVALLGPNGAGKSTTIDMLLGLVEPDRGTISVCGASPRDAVHQGYVSAMMQSGGLLPDLTVGNTVKAIATLFPGADPEQCISRAGLEGFRHRKVSKCSGGQQQRLRYALALIPTPHLLILDEPTTGMDVETRREFWESVRTDAARGCTVVFATHYLAEAEAFADRIVFMSDGRIVADGSTEEIRSMVGGRVVTVHVSQEQVPDVLRAVPGARCLTTNDGRTAFTGGDPDAVVRALVHLTDATDFDVVAPSLEKAFVHFTSPKN